MTKITAKEARQLAGPTLEEKLDSLYESIRVVAIDKKRSLRTGYDHKDDEELWIQGGYSQTADWKAAKKALEEEGFKVTFYYNELSIAVDMYTLIEW